MIIRLNRIAKKETYTIGRLYIDGKYICDTIEDKDRGLYDDMPLEEIKKKKVYGETAIPMGTYKVSITYSPKYKRMMPLVEDVKGFSGIRIHSGNTAKDSLGCIIVGKNTKVGMVTDSRSTYNKLFKMMEGKDNIFITITN